jgi:DNA-binding transcriptional regulator LsrR (DeoR family)
MTAARIEWSEKDKQAQEAAYLYARHHFSQLQISEILECSQSHVSRLLKIAEERAWLQIDPAFVPKGIDKDRQEEIRRRMEPKILANKLKDIQPANKVRVRNVRVFNTGTGSIDSRLSAFGRAAAGRVEELLANSSVVGVSFGETLHRVVEGLEWLRVRPRTEKRLKIVPVAGEVVSYVRIGSSSTWLSHLLRSILNDGPTEEFSLAGVPAFVPRRFEGSKAQVLWEFIESIDSYVKVFRGSRPVIGQIDTLLTSIGQDGKPLALARQDLQNALLDPRGIGLVEEVQSLVVGDVGAVMLPRENLTASRAEDFQKLTEMWTGMTLGHLESIATRADDRRTREEDQAPGVVVLAIGANKALVLTEALRRGLVNELIIDEELARELDRHLESGPSS